MNARQHPPKEGAGHACPWHRSASAKGGVASAFCKQEVAGKAKKNKKSQRGRLGGQLQAVKDMYDCSRVAVKYLSSKGMGTDFRTKRSHAETCVHSRPPSSGDRAKSRARFYTCQFTEMHGSIRQRKGLDTLVHGTGVQRKRGRGLCLLQNKRWQERQEKQKESARQTG